MKQKTIGILDAIIQTSIVGFAASLSVSIAFYHICLGLGGMAFLVKCAVSRKWLGRRTPLDPYFGLFFLACLIATATSRKPLESLVGLKEFFLTTAVYLVAYNTDSYQRIREIASAFLLTAGLSGLYGLLAVAAGLQVRLVGALGMAMTSGSVYMMASLLSLWYLGEAWPEPGLKKWLAAAASLVITASLGLTKTVSSWLGWGLGLFFGAPLKRRLLSLTALLAVASAVIFIYLSSATMGLDSSKNKTWQARLTIWKIGWQIIKEHPVTGVGLIDLGEIYQSKRTAEDITLYGDHRRYGHLHNLFIHITAITGFLGLAAFAAMFWAMIRLSLGNIRSGPALAAPLSRALLAATVAFMVNGLAEWSFGDSEVISTLWFLTGLAVAAAHIGSNPAGEKTAPGKIPAPEKIPAGQA